MTVISIAACRPIMAITRAAQRVAEMYCERERTWDLGRGEYAKEASA